MAEPQTFDIDSAILENLANKTRYADEDMKSPRESEESLSPASPMLKEDIQQEVPEAMSIHQSGYMNSLCEAEAQESPDLQSPVRPAAPPPTLGSRGPHVTQPGNAHHPSQPGSCFETKRDCLIEIRKLRTDGAWFARPYTFEDTEFEMKQAIEMARIELSDKQSVVRNKAGIKTARRVLLAGVSILEFLHKKWNPLRLHLDGFGEYVMGNIDDYDNVFQRLIEKYQGSGQMPPELELVVMLGTSAVMFHISNMFVSRAMNTMPGQTGGSMPGQPGGSMPGQPGGSMPGQTGGPMPTAPAVDDEDDEDRFD